MTRLIPLLLFSASLYASAPCTSATNSCTEFVNLGEGPARGLVYRTYSLNSKNAQITRALVVIHGANRDADNYFRSSLAAAFLADALDNTIIVSPRLASAAAGCHDSLATGEVSWNCNLWRSGGAAASDAKLTSFDFVDQILRELANKEVFPNLKAIVVAGHSAGGQFVTRYEMANRVHGTLGVPITYVVSNPSSYAWLDSTRPAGEVTNCLNYDRWPYGMENISGYAAKQTTEELIKQLAARPTTYLLGEIDILPLGGFDSSCSAMAQGPTRLARGQAFGKLVNEKFGARHEVTIVPLCGHNARCMFTAEIALPILFPKP
jgi:pimeloyl-ACP methyl ester carboxylesterase